MPTLTMKPEEADHLMGMMGIQPPNVPRGTLPDDSAPPDTSGTNSVSALPQIGGMSAPAPPAGSSDYTAQQLQSETDRKPPGLLGKIGGWAASILTPNIAAMIPQTPLGHIARENQLQQQLIQQKQQETQQKTAESQDDMRTAQQAQVEAQTENLKNPQSRPIQPVDVLNARKKGFKYDDEGNLVPIGRDEMTPDEVASEDLKKSVTALNGAKADLEKFKANPNSPEYRMAQARLEMEQKNADTAAERLGLSRTTLQNKMQEQELIKPSGQTQSRGSAAQTVLDIMPGLEDLVTKNAKSMGPLMGRLNNGEIAIGDVPPDVAKLYGAMKSFYALQPAVHGFRNAEFVKDFESAIGTLERDPKAFIAGMQGLKPTIEAVAKEGKTYHKRSVEGAAPDRPKGVPADAKWNSDSRTWTK